MRPWVTGTGGSNRRQPLPRKVFTRNAKPLPGRRARHAELPRPRRARPHSQLGRHVERCARPRLRRAAHSCFSSLGGDDCGAFLQLVGGCVARLARPANTLADGGARVFALKEMGRTWNALERKVLFCEDHGYAAAQAQRACRIAFVHRNFEETARSQIGEGLAVIPLRKRLDKPAHRLVSYL